MRKILISLMVLIVLWLAMPNSPAYCEAPSIKGFNHLGKSSTGEEIYLSDNPIKVEGDNGEYVMTLYCTLNLMKNTGICVLATFDIDKRKLCVISMAEYPYNEWIDIPADRREIRDIKKGSVGDGIVQALREARGTSRQPLKAAPNQKPKRSL